MAAVHTMAGIVPTRQPPYASTDVERGQATVTLVNAIDAGLAMTTGVVRAGEIAANADGCAAEIAARVRVQGFIGIARSVDRVRQAITDTRTRLDRLHSPIERLRAVVDDPSTAELTKYVKRLLGITPLRTMNGGK